jgi:hypothetical protein
LGRVAAMIVLLILLIRSSREIGKEFWELQVEAVHLWNAGVSLEQGGLYVLVMTKNSTTFPPRETTKIPGPRQKGCDIRISFVGDSVTRSDASLVPRSAVEVGLLGHACLRVLGYEATDG